MKLAQTRLENRTYRPNVELCRDNVQYGLTDEVKQIEVTKKALEEKLKQARLVAYSRGALKRAFALRFHFSLCAFHFALLSGPIHTFWENFKWP